MALASASRLSFHWISFWFTGEHLARTSTTQSVADTCFDSHDSDNLKHASHCNESIDWPTTVWWQDRDGWLRDVMENDLPVLLTGTPADSWLARTSNKWTPEYLQRKVPWFTNIYIQPRSSGAFLYHEIGPDQEVVRQEWLHKRHERINISSDIFFSMARSNSTDLYYLALNIMKEWPDMQADLNLTLFKTHSGDIVEPNVWVAGPDVVAQAHYDCNDNIYVQLHGRKTFVMLPPSAVDSCYLHSRYHPSARQCQVSFTTHMSSTPYCTTAGIPGFANGSCNTSRLDRLDTALKLQQLRRVTLSEGDVFYIPPGWFHEAVSEEISVSIALWRQKLPSWLETKFEAEEALLPFEEEWDTPTRCIWVSRFMLVVLEASFTLRSAGDSHRMALKRLSTLLDTRYVMGDPREGSWKEIWDRLKSTDEFAAAYLEAVRPCSNLSQTLVTEELGRKILRYAQPIAAIFAKLPDGIFEWCLDDYVELLSKFAIGAESIPLLVAAILDQCS